MGIRELTLRCENYAQHEDEVEWTAKYFLDKGDRWTPPCVELDSGDDHCPECGEIGDLINDPFYDED